MIAGDVLIGVASSGVHSNGYSLVRKVVEESGLGLGRPGAVRASDRKLGEALLTPTRLYVKSALEAIHAGGVKGFAHITGGGITENLPRALPDGLDAEVDLYAWTPPSGFQLAGETGGDRASGNAAHLQLRHRAGRGGGGKECRPCDRRLPECRRQGDPAGPLIPGAGEAKVVYRGTLGL